MARPKGSPKLGGRKKGTPNKATTEIGKICRTIVDDPVYQQNLLIAARDRKLAPAVETMLWHYAHGKPPEHLTVSGDDEKPLQVIFGGRYKPEDA